MKKSIIDHTYRDYSQTEITDLPDEDRQQTSEELFPAKLHRILNTPEYEDIIAWQPHGRVWKVKNKSVFVSYILPRHFQHSNYESFNRSVNGWGMKVSAYDMRRCFLHAYYIVYVYASYCSYLNLTFSYYLLQYCRGCIKMDLIRRVTIMKCSSVAR